MKEVKNNVPYPFFLCLTIYTLIFICISGCTNGPFRHKILGHAKYATVEFPARSVCLVKPVATVVGVIVDAAIICLDTPADLIYGLTIPITHGQLDDYGREPSDMLRRALMYPLVFPIMYPATVIGLTYSWEKWQYEEILGPESKLFYETKAEESNSPLSEDPNQNRKDKLDN